MLPLRRYLLPCLSFRSDPTLVRTVLLFTALKSSCCVIHEICSIVPSNKSLPLASKISAQHLYSRAPMHLPSMIFFGKLIIWSSENKDKN